MLKNTSISKLGCARRELSGMSLINYLLGESATGEYIPIGYISPLLLLWVIHPHNSHYQDILYRYITIYPQ
jgi:hypothetical protein